ncbi:hypothetical protein POM88_037113 [Heracleum sosnowskyi]|uniref:Ribosomal RNA methyltransferase FtsJ domain-containing protein n=1 Tax=Heracleum sosnowskyi TaxID=360622 RepID=A0AAD8HQJ6_9APIA|nr:hypothetical protein POM88_037113 [Heracleum sosnowskyi]
MFGCDKYNIKPDLVSIAKGLSSAYMPIGAVLASLSSRLRALLICSGEAGNIVGFSTVKSNTSFQSLTFLDFELDDAVPQALLKAIDKFEDWLEDVRKGEKIPEGYILMHRKDLGKDSSNSETQSSSQFEHAEIYAFSLWQLGKNDLVLSVVRTLASSVLSLEKTSVAGCISFISGKVALDSGLSTGGFTDCLLQYGASFVYGVDVGYGQLHEEHLPKPLLVMVHLDRVQLQHLHCLQTSRAVAVVHVTDDSTGCVVEDPKRLLTILSEKRPSSRDLFILSTKTKLSSNFTAHVPPIRSNIFVFHLNSIIGFRRCILIQVKSAVGNFVAVLGKLVYKSCLRLCWAPQEAFNRIADVVQEVVKKMKMVEEEKLWMVKKARLAVEACDQELKDKARKVAAQKMDL